MNYMRKISVVLILLFFCSSIYAANVGIIKFSKGKVLVKQSEKSKKWKKAKIKMKLTEKHIIKTTAKAKAQIQLKNGSVFNVLSNKVVKMKDILKRVGSKNKKNASAMAKLKSLKNRLGKGGEKGAAGPTAVAGVRGADASEKKKAPVRSSQLVWEE